MQINLTFESYEELLSFAKKLAGSGEGTGAGEGATQPVPVQQQTTTQPIPVQPVQQPAPSVPVTNAAPVATPAPAPVPTSAPSYTLDDLARAAMTLMDSGRMADLQQLLGNFGVEALPALPPAQYGAFATALRGLGAQI